MKKLNIYILIITIIVFNVDYSYSQQLPHYSQYMLNDYVVNPAIGGTQDYFQAKSNNRYQWTGIVDAPRTYTLSVYGPHKTKDIGYGGYVYSDVTGPTSRTGAMLSFSYIFKINDEIKISTGLSAGILQFKIDGSKITLHDAGDASLADGIYTDYIPDANFGTYLYSKNYYFGIAARQLIGNKVSFSDIDQLGINKLKNHFFMHGGYTYDITSEIAIEPSVMLKFMAPVPLQVDVNARVIYNNSAWEGKKIWAGLAWRSADAISAVIGYEHNEQIIFGYSYDFTTTNIKNYSTGTHEIMIGARFSKIKKSDESVSKLE